VSDADLATLEAYKLGRLINRHQPLRGKLQDSIARSAMRVATPV